MQSRVFLKWYFLLRANDNAKSRRMRKPSFSARRGFGGWQLERHRSFDRVTISYLFRPPSTAHASRRPSAAKHAIHALYQCDEPTNRTQVTRTTSLISGSQFAAVVPPFALDLTIKGYAAFSSPPMLSKGKAPDHRHLELICWIKN